MNRIATTIKKHLSFDSLRELAKIAVLDRDPEEVPRRHWAGIRDFDHMGMCGLITNLAHTINEIKSPRA